MSLVCYILKRIEVHCVGGRCCGKLYYKQPRRRISSQIKRLMTANRVMGGYTKVLGLEFKYLET